MSINTNLRQLRLDCGMTQEQVAEKIGVTRQAVSSYESGRTRPDIDMLIRLCGIYETDLEGIIYGKSHVLKSMQRIRITALITFSALTVLVLMSSAFLVCLSAVMLAVAALLGMTDSVFTMTDYIITPLLVSIRMIFFFTADIIIEFIQNRFKSTKHRSRP